MLRAHRAMPHHCCVIFIQVDNTLTTRVAGSSMVLEAKNPTLSDRVHLVQISLRLSAIPPSDYSL